MATFTSQQSPFLLDSSFLPKTTTVTDLRDGEAHPSSFPYYIIEASPENAFATPTHESSCPGNERMVDSCNKAPILDKQKPESSTPMVSSLLEGELNSFFSPYYPSDVTVEVAPATHQSGSSGSGRNVEGFGKASLVVKRNQKSPTSMVPNLLLKGEMNVSCFASCPLNAGPEVLIAAATTRSICWSTDGDLDDKNVNGIQKEITPSLGIRRENKDGNCMDTKEVKGKKQKKCSSSSKQHQKKRPKTQKKLKDVSEEHSTGYIHVRARRGQATDKHSLAERVGREKISERMKMLQGLVPGCEKVTAKALMLDEIINYVKSLQHQVEFLSTKLACVNSMFLDLGLSFDDDKPEPDQILRRISSPLPSIQQSVHNPAAAFAVSATTDPSSDYFLPESVASILQMPNDFTQDAVNLEWDVEDQGVKTIQSSWLPELKLFPVKKTRELKAAQQVCKETFDHRSQTEVVKEETQNQSAAKEMR